ncbi:MAG: hypothetical protein HON18_05540 [Rhodospirillaceae bacterium]|nr:hypothetical protein [Rhodospirillaceae bacterium]MBT6240967.1 hypothetical protein [Rhodospirillaceae bacterium]
MFGFGNNAKVKKIFSRLNQVEYFGTKTAEEIVPKSMIENLLNYSADVETVVAMFCISRQAQMAEGFHEKVQYEEMVEEFNEMAQQKGITFGEVFKDQVDGQVDSANQYSDKLAKRFESGELDGTPMVREYCSDQAVKMITAWIMYRTKIREAANYFD